MSFQCKGHIFQLHMRQLMAKGNGNHNLPLFLVFIFPLFSFLAVFLVVSTGGVVLDIKDNYPSSSSIKKVFVLNFCAFHAKGAVKSILFMCLWFLFAIWKIWNLDDGIRFPGFLPKKPNLTESVRSGLNQFSVRFG